MRRVFGEPVKGFLSNIFGGFLTVKKSSKKVDGEKRGFFLRVGSERQDIKRAIITFDF